MKSKTTMTIVSQDLDVIKCEMICWEKSAQRGEGGPKHFTCLYHWSSL